MSREQLNQRIHNVHSLSLHSYATPTELTSAAGAFELAKAIKDNSRIDCPSAFNAVVVYAIANSQSQLLQKLNAIKTAWPLPCFINAADFARAHSQLNTTKFATYQGQPLEWQTQHNTALPLVAADFKNKSLALVNAEGQQAISTIDDALNQTAQLKAQRQSRLQTTPLQRVNINSHVINAGSASQLAQSVSQLGNNAKHWAFVIFVGDGAALQPIKDLL
ncbi:hypothetical protein [Pseudoalteromonas tunicata]|jgi:hypothetical protein|uniref:Uncharacterized protein n=1 Tax=Pseudoalteromonas tunicata D2 TaxID=87626 RepID=A4C8U9_9GAMM|nr:hypothetical protein [Pseudoalteromonas tunicata]ATC93517.1 hypothetical protein PTUN_a0784 [Pseudoalteromonas tunicata]AXT29362.1 hypothetical protein D1819_00025 [Pseudoalteromonas tunicata]EAR29014.1 hypothetical protein PTD2_08219 [Pseudoalteromonas tunicata D2]